MKVLLVLSLAVGLVASVAAAETPSSYAGWREREIKALSPQAVEDLRAGRGMSLALAAELNGYPGPRHVLDLDRELELTPEQREAFEALFLEMQDEARRLGAAIVEYEAAVDHAFASGAAQAAPLRDSLMELGVLQAALRYIHLRAHLRARELLTSQQVVRYNDLRGYGGEAAPGGHDGGHRHGVPPR